MDTKQKGMTALFFHCGIAISLLFAVFNGMFAVFSIINYYIQTPNFSWYQYDTLSYNLPMTTAFMVIGFIALFLLSRFTRRYFSSIGKGIWARACHAVVFSIIAISLIIIAISIVIFLSDFLAGETSLNSFLKTLVAIGIGGMVYYYYRGVSKGAWRKCKKQEQIFVVAVSILVALLLIISYVILAPFQRDVTDQTHKLLGGINMVDSNIIRFYNSEKYLPSDLQSAAFVNFDVHRNNTIDKLNAEYENFYTRTSSTSYRICATFEAIPKHTDAEGYPYSKFPVTEIGENCFDLTVR